MTFSRDPCKERYEQDIKAYVFSAWFKLLFPKAAKLEKFHQRAAEAEYKRCRSLARLNEGTGRLERQNARVAALLRPSGDRVAKSSAEPGPGN